MSTNACWWMRAVGGGLLAGALLLTGCATPRPPAPVEDHSAGLAVIAEPAKPGPPAASAANDARPTTYTVKAGDTLMRIGLETGQGWRDIARWNGIDNPNLIEVGQVLRVMPPASEAVAAIKPVMPPKVEIKPLDPKAAATGASAASAPSTSGSAPAVPAKDNDDEVQWGWPAAGPVATPFDDSRNKGLKITSTVSVVPAAQATRGWPSPARSGIRYSRPPTAVSSTPGLACAATAIW